MKRSLLIAFIFLITIADAISQSRTIAPFNDNWNFTTDTSVDKWEKITLPHTYNSIDMQLGKSFYEGDGFYKKSLFVPAALKGQRVFLRFGGAGQVATLAVNGKVLGVHKGSFAAFVFEITNVVNYGDSNKILVTTNNKARPDIIPVNHFLFPIYGGIYRPVTLITTSPVNITVTDHASCGVQVLQRNVSSQNALIILKAKLENKLIDHQQVVVRTVITDSTGTVVAQTHKDVVVAPQGTTYTEDSLVVPHPHLWNGIYDPYLYKLTVTVLQGDKELDKVVQPLGVRKIELIAGKGVFLNGKKYPMYGVTRHQDRWEKGNALSPADEVEDMMLIKEMGATTIRLAHYQQSEHIYSLADSIGFLIWAEIPFVNAVSKNESENAKQQMEELVRQNRNHPSIYIWGTHNEVYGKSKDDYVPVLTRELNDIAKTNDPDRYTVSVNGYGTMERPENLACDVQGMNRYYGWYDGEIKDLDAWASGLQEKYPDHKVILAEYGADGNIDQVSDTLPTPKNIDPVNGQFSPENYQTETHIQQWAIIEKHPYLLASYLWNSFEFATPMWDRGGVKARNLKGLITFDRKRKKDAFYWYKANWNPEPMLYLANSRDNIRHTKQNTVQVFTNLSSVILKVNGKPINGKKGVNDKHWIYDVQLKKGKNTILLEGNANGKDLSDKMVWTFK